MAVSQDLAQEWLGDVYEAFDGEEGDYELEGEDYDDDFGAGVTIIEAEPAEPEPETDLADEAYADPLALVNAWEGALQDYKASQQVYPEQFLPPTEPPRTLVQNQLKAPFWYGPPPSEASTSKLPAPARAVVEQTRVVIAHSEQQQGAEVTSQQEYRIEQVVDEPTYPDDEEKDDSGQQRKRKRLTGSQKKARKAAKLGLRSMPKRGAAERDGSEPMLESSPPPEAVPPARPLSDTVDTKNAPPPEHADTATAPAANSPAAQTRPTDSSQNDHPPAASLPSPSSFRFVVPPMSSLPRHFPAPPRITPLSGNEPPLDPETPEQLLESALWSWYSAGYQTALYHAAVGVAKFAPSTEASKP